MLVNNHSYIVYAWRDKDEEPYFVSKCRSGSDGPYKDKKNILATSESIIWKTKVQEMHEEVADNIHASFPIYVNLFTNALSLHQSAPDVQEALDYIKRLSKNVNWEAYSDRALEFLYLGDEVEELISDEAEEEVIAQCAWQQFAESCLFEVLSHLQLLAEDDGENASAYKEIHEEYESLGDLLFS